MTGCVLAIDPGNVESAYALIGAGNRKPLTFAKVPNVDMRDFLAHTLTVMAVPPLVAIEQIGHYGTGMPAGRSVFDTCRAIGRLEQIHEQVTGTVPELVLRATVKAHVCGSAKAKDGNVIQALVDRFAPDTRNRGKGTKLVPGWFYGFAADVWQAYALAVYVADSLPENAPF